MEIIINRYDLDFIQKSQNTLEKEFLIPGIDDMAQEVQHEACIVRNRLCKEEVVNGRLVCRWTPTCANTYSMDR